METIIQNQVGHSQYWQTAEECHRMNLAIDINFWQPRGGEPSCFSEWLKKTGDSLPEPESFSEWLTRTGDAI